MWKDLAMEIMQDQTSEGRMAVHKSFVYCTGCGKFVDFYDLIADENGYRCSVCDSVIGEPEHESVH